MLWLHLYCVSVVLFLRERSGPRSGKHPILHRRRLAVFCRAGVQGMVPSHLRGHAMEEAD